MSESNGSVNGLSRLWQVMGPIAITLVIGMTGTYFLFLQDMVTQSELERRTNEIVRLISGNTQDIRRIESTQNQRTSSVADVPALRQEMSRMIAEVRAQEVRLEDLRSRVLLIEDTLRKKATLLYPREERQAHGTP